MKKEHEDTLKAEATHVPEDLRQDEQTVKGEASDDSEDRSHALKRSRSRTARRWQHRGHSTWEPERPRKIINVDEL